MLNQKSFIIRALLGIAVVVALYANISASDGIKKRIQSAAGNGIGDQFGFITQLIQRLVRDAGAVIVSDANPCPSAGDTDTAIGTVQPCLKLLMRDDARTGHRDPIFVWADNATGLIKIQQGSNPTTNLSADNVAVPNNGLSFVKIVDNQGRATAQINLTINGAVADYGKIRVPQKITANFASALAAVFDSSLLPNGATGGTDIGLSAQYWGNLYLGGNFNVVKGKVNQPENFDATHNGRGLMAVGVPDNKDAICENICSYHTGRCTGVLKFSVDSNGAVDGDLVNCATPLSTGGICFCD